MKSHLRWLPWIAGPTALLITLITTVIVNQTMDDARDEQIDRVIERAEGHINENLLMLDALQGLFKVTDTVDRAAFKTFIKSIDPENKKHGLQGIGYAKATTAKTQDRIGAELKSRYEANINVWPSIAKGNGFPIVFLEPLDRRNYNALGYDMYSEPVRRIAMNRAIGSGKPAATDIVELVQEIDGPKQPGILVYLADYSKALPQEDGSNIPRGFIYAPIRIADLMENIFRYELSEDYAIVVHSGGTNDPVIFEHGKLKANAKSHLIEIADKKWSIVASPPPLRWTQNPAFLVFLLGLIGSTLLMALVLTQHRRVNALSVLADERTERAVEKELLLREMLHRIKNSFSRISALASLTARDATNISDYVTLFSARIQALSQSQHLLLEGGIGSVDLEQLILSELNCTGHSQESKRVKIAGPTVQLDDNSAQAIGLTIHELATNSVKYGALCNGGTLSVRWTVNDNTVNLEWNESGLDSSPDLSTAGFGSTLIRALIEHQLGGKLTQTTSNHAMTITINWANINPHD